MNRAARRAAAGMGAMALAAGLAVAGAGAASAEPAQAVATHGDWDITRTISDGTPKVGDTITVTNLFVLNDWWVAPTVNAYRDIHDTCLEYVDGSAKLFTGKGGTADSGKAISKVIPNDDSVRVERTDVLSGAGTNTVRYTLDYTVGPECAGRTLDSTVHVSGNYNTNQTPQNLGPQITVAQSAPADIGGLKVTPSDPNTNQKVTVSGTTSPNTEVTITVGGREFTDQSDGAGEFSVETDTFAAGQHSATVTARNSAGTTDGTIDFTVSEAPTKPGTPSGVKVSPQPVHAGDTVTVSGKAAPGSAVDVELGGKTCQATADGNGTFSCDVTAPDAPGDYQLRVTASNSEGASDAYSTSIPVNAQPTAGQPAVTVDPKNPQAGDSVDITITAPEGAEGKSVSVTVNGNEICQDAVTGADGRATCSTGPLEPGKHEIVVEVEGAESYSTSFAVAEPGTEEPGNGDDGGSGDGGADAGSGSLGSLGFLDVFGSLGLK